MPSAHRTPHRPTPALIRGLRFTRMAVHIARGLATTAVVFPFAGPRARNRMIQRWSRKLLAILAVELEHSSAVPALPERALIVANHISWLDIFVLNAMQPARFIAKSDIRQWPAIGRLCHSTGTLFVDRTRRRDAARINEQVMAALAAGDLVAFFPEGTTTEGRELLPFHGSLLQPVIEAGGHVLPAAIRYLHPDGSHSTAPAYVGETSLVESFGALLRARRTRVHLHLHAPLPTAGRHRREIAAEAHAVIRTALDLPAPSTVPGTPAGPRAAQR